MILAEQTTPSSSTNVFSIASQRVQIALYSLQMQDAAVARAIQRADEVHNRCVEMTANRDSMSAEIQETERALASGTLPETRTIGLSQHLGQQKKHLDIQNAAVQACQAAESEASDQVRSSRTKLAELQDRIERLD